MLAALSLCCALPCIDSGANCIEPVQDGRIHIEKMNRPFLYQFKGTPAEYKAEPDLAIANRWLWMRESGTYVKLTEAGAAMFA